MKLSSRNKLRVLTAAIAMSAGSASLGEGHFTPLGAEAPEVPMTAALLDAARSFAKVDINRDGLIDADEYAAQRVVYAQLARLNRAVPIDGQKPMVVKVPSNIPDRLGASERAALDAVARRDFHMKVLGKEGLDESGWQDARLGTFYLADRDGDNVLRGAELGLYAGVLSGELSATFPAS